MHGTAAVERFLFVGRAETLPPPLDQAAALPTLIVIGGDRAVEHAIVGAHAREDLEKLLRGDAAKPAAGKGVR
jgi:arginase family enzyme